MVYIQGLKNLDTALHVSVKIGQISSSVSCVSKISYEDALGEVSPILTKIKKRLQVIHFPSSELEPVMTLIEKIWKNQNGIKVVVVSENELKRDPFLKYQNKNISDDKGNSFIKGCNFLLLNVRDEAYIFNDMVNTGIKYLLPNHKFYPHIFVRLNSKFKVLKVNSPESSEFLEESDMDIIIFSEEAKASVRLDSLNETISLEKLFLSIKKYSDETLHSTDSVMNQEKSKTNAGFALIKMVCNKIGISCTSYAKFHHIDQIMFEENLSDDIVIKQLISDSVKNCSGNNIKALFLRHEKFIDGIGDLLSDSSTGIFQNSWTENYSESSGLVSQKCVFQGVHILQLTLDSINTFLTCSPLLSNCTEYFPDTQNLSENISAREYWLNCIAEGVCQGMERMAVDAKKEAIKNICMYKDLVLDRLAYLKINHQSYGNLSMRLLQDTMETMKREMGLINMYEKRKRKENVTALKELGNRLNYLGCLSFIDFHNELIKSVLAGNMFDWGAKEVAKLLSVGKLNFHQAMEKLPERPWLIDDLDEWIKRIKEVNYKNVMIFADNSGYDLIVGVLPLVREFIKKEAKVVICVNSEPIINDVTFYEVKELLEDIKNICPTLRNAIEKQTLTFMQMAKSSCCLDLSFVDVEIAKMMESVDLLVIEGMGRTVHTNLFAEFTCDTLRLAVIKDHWLSKQLGGDKFSCICKFTYGASK